jgi:hypothetical protein
VRALDRLERVHALGAGQLDLSGVPPARVVALGRYADQAWATQLAYLGPERRIATLVAYTHLLATSARDDVIDIFDVVFERMRTRRPGGNQPICTDAILAEPNRRSGVPGPGCTAEGPLC